MRRVPSLFGIVIVAGATLLAQRGTPPPQTPAPPQAPQATFRVGVDSVSVDVTVTDKQGRPVLDLKPEDFEVREGKQVQTIDQFKLITIEDNNDVDPVRAPEILSLEDQARETANPDNRLYIIFLDDYHVRLGNSMRIREKLAQWVRQLTPRDLVAIVYPLTPMKLVTFSRNHEGTAAAILKFMGRKYNYTPTNELENRYALQPPSVLERLRNALTIDGLEGTCHLMATLRDGRKSVLFVSEGMSSTLPAGVNSIGAVGATADPGTAPTTSSQAFFTSAELILRMREMFSAAARSNTAIYTIDPRGLAASEFDVGDRVGHDDDVQVLREATDVLRIIANETDGRAIVNRNEPITELKQMVRDMSAYYLLGYTSSLAPRDGKFHEIDVRVKRKDVEVRARKGYWALSADDIERASTSSRPAPSAEVNEALEGLASVVDTTTRRSIATWIGATRGAGQKASLVFAWEPNAGPRADSMDAPVQVTLIATSAAGDVLFRGPVKLDPQAVRPGGRVTFDAPPGLLRMRIMPENARGQRLEPSDASFDVPDFTGTAALISTPVVFRGRTARDLQAIKSAPAPVPSVGRQFSRTERLLVRFDAYGPAGTSPKVSMRLLNNLGDAVTALPDPVQASGSTFDAEVGLASFAAGDYVIEITATSASDTSRKFVAIRVTG